MAPTRIPKVLKALILTTISPHAPSRRAHRTLNRVIAALLRCLLCLLLAGPAMAADPAAGAEGGIAVRRAVLVTGTGERPVELPHQLASGDFAPDGGRVRYRLEVDLPEAPRAPLALYVRKLSLSGALTVNGRPAGACGVGALEALRCLHRPQLFVPPSDVWRAGTNTVEFEIFANDRQMNGLGVVLVGDAYALSTGPHRTRMLWQVESIHALTWITLALAVLSLAVGAVLRKESVYLWFGVASLTNAASNLNVLVTTPAVGFELFSWFVFAIRMTSVALMQLMLLSFFGKATRTRRRALLGYALATPVLLWFLGSERWLVIGLYVPLQLTGAALMIAMIRWSWRSRRWSESVMTLAYATTFLLGQFDFARLGGVGAFEGVYMIVYASATMTAVIGATLVSLLASSLATSRRLTAALDREVAARTADLEQANARLAELLMTDGMTGIANRRRFDEALQAEWARARRDGGTLTLLMIDVDHFKHYNDALGHLAGDDCLHRVAQVIREHGRRAGDLAARYGGEEFALLTRAGREQAHELAESLRKAVFETGMPHPGSPQDRVSVSVGLATVPTTEANTPSVLLRLADEALYAAKRGGRNRVEVAPG